MVPITGTYILSIGFLPVTHAFLLHLHTHALLRGISGRALFYDSDEGAEGPQ